MLPNKLDEAIEFIEIYIQKCPEFKRTILIAFSKWCQTECDLAFREYLSVNGFEDVDGQDDEVTLNQITEDFHETKGESHSTKPLHGCDETTDYADRSDNRISVETVNYADRESSSVSRDLADDANRFEIRRKVAQGGLGVVFVAEDKQFQRYVALKKVRMDRATSSQLSDKFLFEAEVTGQLEHPGIVPVYALGLDGQGQPYYAMKLVRGEEFSATIQRLHAGTRLDYGSMGFRNLLRRFIDVCLTMDYAHTRGVIHRDLKPANIMVGSHAETLVVDWGLARSINRQEPLNLVGSVSSEYQPIKLRRTGDLGSHTVHGTFSGTIAYAPPEQLLGDPEPTGARL